MPHAYAPYTSIARNFSFIMNLLTDKAPAFWNKTRILLLFWEKRYLITVLLYFLAVRSVYIYTEL